VCCNVLTWRNLWTKQRSALIRVVNVPRKPAASIAALIVRVRRRPQILSATVVIQPARLAAEPQALGPSQDGLSDVLLTKIFISAETAVVRMQVSGLELDALAHHFDDRNR
jgi:hypothetical protein